MFNEFTATKQDAAIITSILMDRVKNGISGLNLRGWKDNKLFFDTLKADVTLLQKCVSAEIFHNIISPSDLAKLASVKNI